MASSLHLNRFVARVNNYTTAETKIRSTLLALIVRFWADLKDPHKPEQVAVYSQRVADAVRRAQVAEMNLAIAQQRLLLADANVKLARFTPVLPEQPRGVDPRVVAERAARDARYYESTGIDSLEAKQRALEGTLVRHSDDLDLAGRDGTRQALQKAAGPIVGYRRVIHPELSKTGVCGLCVAASDRIYTIETLLPIHARCVAGDTEISGRDVSRLMRRWYAGPLVVIRTASGQQLRVTPNHPVLTDQGWVPAGFVSEGDAVIRSRAGHRMNLVRPDEEHRVTAEDLWSAAVVRGRLDVRSVPLAPEDFYGDGTEGEVDVVDVYGLLADVGDISFSKPPSELNFVAAGSSGGSLPTLGLPQLAASGLSHTPGRFVGGSGHSLALCERHSSVPDSLGFAHITSSHSGFGQTPGNYLTTDTEALSDALLRVARQVSSLDRFDVDRVTPGVRFDPSGLEFTAKGRCGYASRGLDLLRALAGEVEPDRVVEAGLISFTGHVYDLETRGGWFGANTHIVSNCACTVSPVIGGQDDLGNEQNQVDLGELYRLSKEHTTRAIKDDSGKVVKGPVTRTKTHADALSKVRFRIDEHGELGPYLRPHSKGADDPAIEIATHI